MSKCCLSGGITTLRFNGAQIKLRGRGVDISGVSGVEISAEANADGTVTRMAGAVVPTFGFSSGWCCDQDIASYIGQCGRAVVTCETTGAQWVMSDAMITGNPSQNTQSGEISGLSMTGSTITPIAPAA